MFRYLYNGNHFIDCPSMRRRARAFNTAYSPLFIFKRCFSSCTKTCVTWLFLTLSVKLFISSRIYYTRINLKFSGKCFKFLWSFKNSLFIVTTAALCIIVMVPPLHWFIAGQRHKLFIVGSSDHTFIHGCGRPKNDTIVLQKDFQSFISMRLIKMFVFCLHTLIFFHVYIVLYIFQ